MKGHDLKPVGSHKQILSCVQTEPSLTGVHKLDDSLHDRRRHLLQSYLSEAGLNKRACEHGSKVRADGCQEDSEGWQIEDNRLCEQYVNPYHMQKSSLLYSDVINHYIINQTKTVNSLLQEQNWSV